MHGDVLARVCGKQVFNCMAGEHVSPYKFLDTGCLLALIVGAAEPPPVDV
mgnify:FL=1